MGGIRVLIVDDQELYRSALSGLLDIVGGYEVVGLAASGEEGIELTSRTMPDLVFMDLRLPGVDGLAAARSIRDAPDPPEVIMISTDVEGLPEHRVRAAGALAARAKADLDPEWLESLRDRLTVAPPGRRGR